MSQVLLGEAVAGKYFLVPLNAKKKEDEVLLPVLTLLVYCSALHSSFLWSTFPQLLVFFGPLPSSLT
jgi:hypothetical protein